MKALIGRLSDGITEIAKFALGLCVAAIVLITLASVWWRYVINAPIAWIEQVSNILFIWITFIGAAVLYRQKLHIGVDMFIGMLTRRLGRGPKRRASDSMSERIRRSGRCARPISCRPETRWSGLSQSR